jgi:hypothetical protein
VRTLENFNTLADVCAIPLRLQQRTNEIAGKQPSTNGINTIERVFIVGVLLEKEAGLFPKHKTDIILATDNKTINNNNSHPP